MTRPDLAEMLDLRPHPEGGWFRETWRGAAEFEPEGQRPQVLVPGGVWQAAAAASDAEVLVSCVVSPGFDFADFRMED